MAYSVTIADIKRRARQRADMEGSAFISDTELLDMINESYTGLYDLLVSSFENYFVAPDFTINITSGNDTYALPSDFYKIIGVDWKVTTNQYVTLFPYMEAERNLSFTNTINIPTGTVRMRYVPAPTVFTADTDTFDSVSGWDTLVVTDVAIMMLEKEESDTSSLRQRKNEAVRRILEMSHNRDQGQPGRISDVYQTDLHRLFTALRYHIYGNNLRFVSTELLGSDFLLGVQI